MSFDENNASHASLSEAFSKTFNEIKNTGYLFAKNGFRVEKTEDGYERVGRIEGFKGVAEIVRLERYCAITCNDGTREIGSVRDFQIAAFAKEKSDGTIVPAGRLDDDKLQACMAETRKGLLAIAAKNAKNPAPKNS